MTRKLLILAVAATAYSQDALSLRDAVRQAMARSKVIEASGASNDAALAQITQARSGFLPRVNFAESWTRSHNPVFVFSSLLTQQQFSDSNFVLASLNHPDFLNNFQSLVTADQPLYDAGKTKRAMRTAELGKDLQQEEACRRQMEVISQVVLHYSDTQLGEEQVKVARQSMRSAEADLERAETRRSNGMATDADVLSIRVHIAAIHDEQIRRNAGLEVSRAAMNDAIGLPLDTDHALTTQLAREIAGVQAADAHSNYLPQVALH